LSLPPYCDHFLDRHGRPRSYFRYKKQARIALPGLPWSPEFMAAHAAALQDAAPSLPTNAASRFRKGAIYVVCGGSFVKIGYSTNVAERLASLQTASPTKLELLATFPGSPRDERQLHERFAGLHSTGEWFRKTPELLAFIEQQKRIKERATRG